MPEVRLHRALPGSRLRQLAGSGSPYWAYPWPGGSALARHVLDHPGIVRHRRVLDLGAGSGLVGIAAAKAGAARVLAAEVDPVARVALALNAVANAVSLDRLDADVLAAGPPGVDLVLVGDLFYAAELARRVSRFLERCRAAGIDALIGDVGRRHLPVARLRRVAEYPVAEFAAAPGAPLVKGGVFAVASA